MSIIHTYLTTGEVRRLSLADRDYLKRKLEVNCLLNDLLHRPINRPLLADLLCILNRKPIPRQKTEQYRSNGKVSVYNATGMLIRMEHSSGRVVRQAW